jgi:hypothetical protein
MKAASVADATAGPPPSDVLARQKPAVSGAAVVGWLLAFTLLEWARGKFLSVASPHLLASIPGALSALECLELILIARMFNWRTRAPSVGAVEALAPLALIAVACVVLNDRPFFSAGALSLFILVRFGRTPEHRALAIALFAFVAQYLLQAGPFIWLHAFVGSLDAAVVRSGLRLLGYDITGQATLVIHASQKFAIDVLEGCASSYVASVAIPGFVIVVLALRGRLQWPDLAYATALLVAVVLVNWLRLVPIALSREGWLFWHEGAGASIVALGDGVLVVGMAWLATRRGRKAGKPQ